VLYVAAATGGIWKSSNKGVDMERTSSPGRMTISFGALRHLRQGSEDRLGGIR
jgi:hypothetical protein